MRLFGEAFLVFFDLSAEWWLWVRVPKLFGSFRQLGVRLFGKRRVLGARKIHEEPGKASQGVQRQFEHSRVWGQLWAAPSIPRDAPGKRKGCWKINQSAEKGPEITRGPGKNALQWETQRASPLYLIRKKNESDLITAHWAPSRGENTGHGQTSLIHQPKAGPEAKAGSRSQIHSN